jgi:hypothetical protein
MPIPALRAVQSSTTTGTGTLTMLAAPSTARSFQAAYGTGARVVRYFLQGATYYEIGLGSFDGGSPGTLARNSIIASSNANSTVSIPAGTTSIGTYIDVGDRVLIESAATTISLSSPDLGNLLNWSGTAICTVALPGIVNIPPGASYEFKNNGTAALRLDPNGSETVNGLTTLDLLPGDHATVIAATGGWVLASPLPSVIWQRTQVAVSSSVIDFALPAGFASYELRWHDVRPGTGDAVLWLRTSVDGGASFAAGSTDYVTSSHQDVFPGGTVPATNTITSAAILSFQMNVSLIGATNQGAAVIFPGSQARVPLMRINGAGWDGATDGISTFTASAERSSAATINAIRVLCSTGNIATGTFVLSGLRA